jgi:hypothetical protein
MKLRVECSVGARPNVSEARSSVAAWRHPGEKVAGHWRVKKKKKRHWRVAKKKRWESSRRLECARFISFIGRAREPTRQVLRAG